MNPLSYAFATKTPEPAPRTERTRPCRVAKAIAAAVLALFLAAGPVAAMAVEYTDGNAGPDFSPGDVAGGISAALGSLGDDISELTGFSSLLRGVVNNNLANTNQALKDVTASGLLSKKLSDAQPEAYEWLKTVHKNIAIPLANVVLLVFMVVGLGKVVSHAGRTDSGVDLWQLVMVFVAYAFAKTIIDASWELMEFSYEIVRTFIQATLDKGVQEWDATAPYIGDNVKNPGTLFTMMLVTLVTWFGAWLCGLVANVVVIVRIIQIYVYTALAPISLGTLTAEGGRQMATGFLKRYAALILSGLIMAVLFILFGLMIQGSTLPAAPNSPDGVAVWSGEMVASIGWAVAFAYCLFKSGAWARDFVGV